MHIGGIISKLRKEKRMTLVELSSKSGVALATLSRIENGKMTGTIKSHIKICDALGLPLTDLYTGLSSSKRSVELKSKESARNVFIHSKKSSSILLASNVQKKKLLPLLITIAKSGKTNSEENPHGAEKFVYVIGGKIEASIGGEKYQLGSGDTIYFDSSVPHHFTNAGNSEARILSVSNTQN